MTINIHPTAIVETGATIDNNVTIEAYAIIKSNVTLKSGVTIKAHAYIDGHTTIGENSTIWPFASVGTQTQAIKFKGEVTYVTIGSNCNIREYVTINSSYDEGSTVSIGDNCLIMAYCHVAHHCSVGNNVIMSNGAMLAGHVTIEDYATIGGMTPIHQFASIGKHAMVGGMSRVTHDIPPYTIGAGIPYKMGGLNTVGLKRHDFSYENRMALSKAFQLVYRSDLSLKEALVCIEKELPQTTDIQHWVDFCRQSKRGLIGL